jgi:hypothetical protein
MTDNTFSESFRLSTGGLFYSLLIRLRIQQPDQYSIRRRILVLTTLCWLPLILLATYEGNLINHNLDAPFIYDLKPYVRFLLIVPLLIVADALIDPLIASNLQSIGSSGLIGDQYKDKYIEVVQKFRLRKDSYLADIVILLIMIAVIISFIINLTDPDAETAFTHWSIARENNEPQITYAGWWLALISSPILQILLFRWLWRFYLWTEFLFRVSRIKLRLQPTHPDMAGGLGILKNGESSFTLIFVAFGALLSVSLAEEIMYDDMTLLQTQPILAVYIAISILVMTLPLVFFTGQLIKAKRWGRVVYGGLGYRLSQAFDQKWGNPQDKTGGEELLKTADASAVCDYSDVYEVVREMRYLPIRVKDLVAQAFILAVPFMPLVFTEIPISEVVKRVVDAVI